METHPFMPLPARYQAALHRVVSACKPEFGERDAADCFARCIEDAHQLGLRGNALIIAAEHMATGRYRRWVQSRQQQLAAV